MSEDNNEETTMSPGDIEKVKAAKAAVAQAEAALNDIPEDVREEYGELEDALSKLDEVADHLNEVVSPDENGDGAGAAAASD